MDEKIFDRVIALQMAQTQEEALKILRTDPILTEEEAQEMSKNWPKLNQEQRPTLEDFFEATDRREKEAILQKMDDGTLTPEELEAFFPKV